jgi:hypothetical protein
VDDEVRVVEIERTGEVAASGGRNGEVAVAGVFEAVDGAEFPAGGGDVADFAPGGIREVVHRAFGEAVGDGEDLLEFEAGGFGERREIGAELVFGDGRFVELAEDDGLDAGLLGGFAEKPGAVEALFAEVEVADDAAAGHVSKMGCEVREVGFLGKFREFAVFIAVGAEEGLFEGEAGGAVGQGAVAHVGVAVVEAGDDDEGAGVELRDGGVEFDGGDGVLNPGEATRAVRHEVGAVEDDAVAEFGH